MINREDFNNALGERIREEREIRGISLETLSTQSNVGISRSAMSAIERGKQQVSVYHLFLLAKYLKISLDDVIQPIGLFPNEKVKSESNRNIINEL